jgi:uncharacterized protein YegL
MSEQVLPFYLLCDESTSMTGDIQAINDSLLELHNEIGSNPVIADKTHFCLIGFSTAAQVLVPLADLSLLDSMPLLQVSGATNYGAAFDLLRDTITNDVAKLKAGGNIVYRPAVFFLSDGQPTDDHWDASYQRLIDSSWGSRPNILAFGFGTAEMQTLHQIATVRAFVHDPASMTAAKALRELTRKLIQSMITSGSRPAADGSLSLTAPEQVPGFITLPSDQI